MIICKICNETIDLSIQRFYRVHLKKEHDITPKMYYDEYYKKDEEGFCYCGKETKYKNSIQGYSKYCSLKCSTNHTDVIHAIRRTKLRKYGDENFNNPDKRKESFQDKYGVDNISQLEVIKELKKQTCFENFGVESPMRNELIKQQARNTMFEKYGYFNPSQILKFQEKKIQTSLDKYGVENYSQSDKYRKEQEDKGNWVEKSLIDDFTIYYRRVWNETRKYKSKLLAKWNGRCHYTNEVLIDDKKQYNHENYRTIDHKISVYRGFIDNIDYKIIGNIDNLCICSRRINIIKNKLTEQEFKKLKICRI